MNVNDLPFSLDEFAKLCNRLPYDLLVEIKSTFGENVPNLLARRGIINDALRAKQPSNQPTSPLPTVRSFHDEQSSLYVIKTGFNNLYAVVDDSPCGVKFSLVDKKQADTLVSNR